MSLLMRIFRKTVLRFPSVLLPLYKSMFDLSSDEQRFFRARLLRSGIKTLQNRMADAGFRSSILVEPKCTRVLVEGAFMDVAYATRYLKIPPSSSDALTIAVGVADFLDELGIQPRQIIDVGANDGEFTLYLLQRFAGAQILAIEASTESFNALNANVSFNSKYLDVSKIQTVQVAASNQKGNIQITRGLGASNSIVTGSNNSQSQSHSQPEINSSKLETVPANTIDAIAMEHGIDQPDFIKVDIEGAEPLLLDGLITLSPRAIFCEFSNVSPVSEYLELVRGLLAAGYTCHNRAGLPFKDEQAALDHVVDTFESKLPATDLWFTRNS